MDQPATLALVPVGLGASSFNANLAAEADQRRPRFPLRPMISALIEYSSRTRPRRTSAATAAKSEQIAAAMTRSSAPAHRMPGRPGAGAITSIGSASTSAADRTMATAPASASRQRLPAGSRTSTTARHSDLL